MGARNYVYAVWMLDPGDAVEAVKQLADECPVSWGSDEPDAQFEGFSLEDGTLTLTHDHKHERLYVRFEARVFGRLPKDYWLSPLDLLGKSATEFAIRRGQQ